MSDFEVRVYEAKVLEHPNADTLDLVQIGGYLSAVRKDTIKDGDAVAYIPEDSIVPESLLEEMGLKGRLSGKNKDRVKAVRLREVVSQGLVHKVDYPIGSNVQSQLGIIKYEPPIPVHMNGQVYNSRNKTLRYDIENIKKYPNVLKDGENVVVTEKLHGTQCCMGYYNDEPIVSSKGLSKGGLAFKHVEENDSNLYIRCFNEYKDILDSIHMDHPIFYVLGEIHGKGVQKKFYYGSNKPVFRMFDVWIGDPVYGRFIGHDEVYQESSFCLFPTVPLLYRGPFSQDKMDELKTGMSTVLDAAHIREGIVIKADPERVDADPINGCGRVILKDINDDYATRKGGTDYQ